MPPALNKNHSGVKRIMQEARELAADDSTEYTAAPLEDDIFEWHGTLRGPAGTDYEGGLYHFRILLPAEYPFRPPAIQLLTPSGRFELNTNICISFTNYHEDLWQPAWGVRTVIIGLQGFFPLNGKDAVGVGGVEYPSPERKRLAKLSRDWCCPTCHKSNSLCLPDVDPSAPTTVPTVQDPASSTPVTSGTPATSSSPPVVVTPTPTQPTESPRSASTTTSSNATPAFDKTSATMVPARPRPPVILDATICILLILACALAGRRFL